MKLSIAIVLALGLAACGGGDEGGGPTSPSTPAVADGTGSGGTSSGGTSGGTGSGGGCTRPPAPANFAAAVSGSTASISWSAVSGAYDYVLRIGTAPNTSNLLSTNTTQTTYNWNGVPRGTYYAVVEARSSCGSGAEAQLTITIS